MSTYDHVRIFIWVFGVPMIVALTIRAVRKVRAIRHEHEALLEEERQNPQDPYARLAELFAEKKR